MVIFYSYVSLPEGSWYLMALSHHAPPGRACASLSFFCVSSIILAIVALAKAAKETRESWPWIATLLLNYPLEIHGLCPSV